MQELVVHVLERPLHALKHAVDNLAHLSRTSQGLKRFENRAIVGLLASTQTAAQATPVSTFGMGFRTLAILLAGEQFLPFPAEGIGLVAEAC